MHARVLIIDDHPGYVEILRAAALARGFQVVGNVTDANDAVRLCADLQPEIVVLDLHLSGDTNGLDLARLLSELHPEMSIIGAGPFVEPDAIDRAFAHGVQRCLRKPFRVEEALRLFQVVADSIEESVV